MAAQAYRILRGGVEDVADIFDIEQQCFTIPWSYEAIMEDVTSRIHTVYFVAKDTAGKTVGFGGMYTVVDEAHITNMAVLPEVRNKGVGDMLLGEMIAYAQKQGCSGATLEVRVSNAAAIRLYQKFGFEVEGRREAYYRDNREDAHIMWLRFA